MPADLVWWTFGGVLVVGLLLGLLLAALGQIGRAIEWLRDRRRPPTPRVAVSGLGARMSRGHVVSPTYRIENENPHPIYNVSTGLQRRGSPERVTCPGHFGVIHAGSSAAVSDDDFRIPAPWLAGYDGDFPQHEVLYWVRFEDGEHRRWELQQDPAGADRRYSRLGGRDEA